MASISIVGDLINDQSVGLTDDDILFTDLDPAFSAYITSLGLSASQLAFAAAAGAAQQQGLVAVNAGPGEVVDSLIFAPLVNGVTGLSAVTGGAITLTTILGGQAVQAVDGSGDLVALFWMIL